MRTARLLSAALLVAIVSGCATLARLSDFPQFTGKSISVRVFNVDDISRVYVNGTKVMEVGFLHEDSRDLTSLCGPGKNSVELTTENTGAGYTWGFDIIVDGKVVFHSAEGVANRQGANNDDHRMGIVYDYRVNFTPQ